MRTVADLFREFKGPTKVARILGVGTSTASEMKRRSSVPVEHWPALIAAAPAHDVKGLTADVLVRIHARKARRPALAEARRATA